MCGYQGWFNAEGDGGNRGYNHWARGGARPGPGRVNVDLWPDLTEFDATERFPTDFVRADGTRADFAHNTLVVIVPSSAAKTPQALPDLAGADFKRIATGTPTTVPVGRYTMEAVQKAGLTDALQPRWIFGESVRQVLNYVARGEVDAGFVYRTDALIERDKTRIAFTAPTTTPVSYPIAAIAASKNAEGAQQFIRFVRSPAGGEILERFGFSKP